MKKLLPIGIHDFKELIEKEYYYVDKTLLIKEIWDSGKVILAPRPRRFGKTLNLSMLSYFFAINRESQAHLFYDKLIWQHLEMQKIQGRFPVVFLTFKSAVFTTFTDMYEKITAIVAAEFNNHKYLLEGNVLDQFEKNVFERIRQGKPSQVELSDSLEYLVKFLNRYHQKKIIVLIDEYDVPVQSAFLHGFYDEIIELLKPLLTSAFKDNAILEKGVITGILTLAKAGIFTGLNNLDVFNITSSKLADKFGFTTDEANELLAYYGINDIETIKRWYNGYVFGETQGIFNPWSMLKCAQNNGALQIYWANTSDNALVKRLITRASLSVKSELESLLRGIPIKKTIEESIIFPDLDHQSELIWSLLLFTGYITSTHCELQEGKKECMLSIPNDEIKFLYRDLIRKIFMESVVGGQALDLLQALTEGHTEIFMELLQSFVIKSMSSYDLPDNEAEKSYHLFVLGLLVMLSDNYTVKSNREGGLGRYDIMITALDPHKPSIVIELKKAGKKETLEEASQRALDQIIENRYFEELPESNRKSIIAYGIGFQRKDLFITSARLIAGVLEK